MLNKAMLIGNLGDEPEGRFTQSGIAVSNFSVCTSERWKDKDGQQQQTDEWHRVVAWRNLAEICNKYLHKGSKVYIEGKLQTRKWQDQNGNDRYTTEIVASNVQFLTPRGEGGGCYSGGGGGYDPGPAAGGHQSGSYDDFSGGSSGGGTGNSVPF